MDSRFLPNYYDPYMPSPATYSTTPARRPSAPKVVSVPVRFVQSQRLSSEAAAMRIQKAFRGFRVRKALGKIRAVWAEVAAMERRVEDAALAERLRRDEKERVRVNEALMGLLFKLDSVPGVDPAVRDCRKTAIRRVVALQERVDSLIESRDEADLGSMEEQLDQPIEVETRDCDLNTHPIDEELTDDIIHDARELSLSDPTSVEDEGILEEEKEMMVDADDLSLPAGEEDECVVNATGGDESGLKEVMERMVEENMKLQRMIRELYEREEKQSMEMSSLSRRVEALEKAVAKKRKTKTKKDKSCNSRKGRSDL